MKKKLKKNHLKNSSYKEEDINLKMLCSEGWNSNQQLK